MLTRRSCQGLLRLDCNQPLHVANLIIRKENIRNVDFLLSRAGCDQEEIRRAKPETITEKVVSALLKQHAPRIVALLTAADQMFFCELPRDVPAKTQGGRRRKTAKPK